MNKQLHLSCVEKIAPTLEKKDTFRKRVSFYELHEEIVLSLIVSVLVEKNIRVEIRLLFDPLTEKIFKVQQGKGSSWIDVNLSRREAKRVKIIVGSICKRYLEKKYSSQLSLSV